MKETIENMFGFIYSLSVGDYLFFVGTFLLIMSFIYVVYLIKREDLNNDSKNDILDIAEIKNKIENEYAPKEIILSDYEEEQEKNAIISYEELVKNKDNLNITYDKNYEYDNEEISVKKINLDKEGIIESNSELKVTLMQYDKEEEFLVALKQLQQNLLN